MTFPEQSWTGDALLGPSLGASVVQVFLLLLEVGFQAAHVEWEWSVCLSVDGGEVLVPE